VVYDIENSSLKRPLTTVVTLEGLDSNKQVSIDTVNNVKYLFTTKTCPNCKLAKEYLKDESYILIDAEENVELTQKYGVMQAPTLVVVNGDKVKKYANASNIKKYADTMAMVTV